MNDVFWWAPGVDHRVPPPWYEHDPTAASEPPVRLTVALAPEELRLMPLTT
jgi:hypothetical protein